MASRYYGLDRGEGKNSVTEDSSSTATTDAEVRVDLVAAMSRSEVLLALEIIKDAIAEADWPPLAPPTMNWAIAGPDTVAEAAATATYTISYADAEIMFNESVLVTLDAAGGTAVEVTDFGEVSPTVLTFTSAATSQTATVLTVADTTADGDLDYTVEISSVSYGDIATQTATTTIIDDD
jgi:hypothetical protein